MERSWKCNFSVHSACYYAILAAFCLCFSIPLYAQLGPSGSCPSGGQPSSGTRGDGDDIQCRINNLLNSNQNLVNSMKDKMSSCNGAHCDLIMDHLNRAQASDNRAMKANGRVKGSDYADLNTIRKTKCMGKKSDCAAGNDNGSFSGGDTDPTVGSDIADQLDSATDALDKANKMVSDSNAPLFGRPREATTPPNFTPLYDYSTDPEYPTWLHQGLLDPSVITPGIRFEYLLVAQANETLKQVSEDACKQEAVVVGEGGNTSLACMVLTIIARASEAAYEVFEFANNNSLEWEAHGAYERAENINSNLGQVDSDVAAVAVSAGNTELEISQLQAQVTTLQNSINSLRNQLTQVSNQLGQKMYVNKTMNKQIMQMLLGPAGNRTVPASLLTCSGDGSTSAPCPAIILHCSVATGVCSYSGH